MASNSITGNAVNNVGLETDLSNILNPESNATVIVENNSNNASGDNQNILQINETIQKEEQSYENKKEKIKETSENKFTVSSINEDEIINQIEEKTNLGKDKIKKAIKFKRKELVIAGSEKDAGEGTAVQPSQQSMQQSLEMSGYSKVNGSIILRLG